MRNVPGMSTSSISACPHHSAHRYITCAFPTGRTRPRFMHKWLKRWIASTMSADLSITITAGAEARLHLPEQIEVHQHIVADAQGNGGPRSHRYHGLQVVPTAADTAKHASMAPAWGYPSPPPRCGIHVLEMEKSSCPCSWACPAFSTRRHRGARWWGQPFPRWSPVVGHPHPTAAGTAASGAAGLLPLKGFE